jgi:hypothetical protein
MAHRDHELTGLQILQARNELRRTVEAMLRGSSLEIRELAHDLTIGNLRQPDKGRIHIPYKTADVSLKRTTWTYLGPLRGYEPNDDPDREPSVDAATIIAALSEPEPGGETPATTGP